MSQQVSSTIAVIGVDIGKNSFHVVGLDQRGAIVLRQKWSRGQVESRLANIPPCLIGMEACVGAHDLKSQTQDAWSAHGKNFAAGAVGGLWPVSGAPTRVGTVVRPTFRTNVIMPQGLVGRDGYSRGLRRRMSRIGSDRDRSCSRTRRGSRMTPLEWHGISNGR
jgi:hypothetical protein